MRPADNINELIKKLQLKASADLDRRVHDDISMAPAESDKTKSVVTQPKIRRTIMKNPITKLAAAAVIIVLVVMGLFEFIGTENTSGVVWAEVVRKVEASRGLIVRCTESIASNEDDYSITHTSPRYSRMDFYDNGQITRTCYIDFTDSDTDTLIDVYHIRKFYLTTIFKKSGYGIFPEQHEGGTNPSLLVKTILSCEHSKLGEKTIEGILCEGIETTDPASMGPTSEKYDRLDVLLRLWVSVETGYPVLFERKLSAEYQGEAGESESVMDQFQWDVELDPSIFEPNIPPDYEGVTRPGIVEP